ncbi:unnamed protein product [Allacma fusca]|uniref:AAA+ ATPase domain-containing protein n=1 Tax=Allacma fusca TaxID=39272 RepID=A0A8J2LPH8_9HEXA|nr:unnamed protein product [Allacma fusca]
MSAKKKAKSPWYDCGKCGQRLLSLFATKHNDLNCGTIFPIIENGVLVSTVSKVPSNSKISQLPFINSPMGLSTVFLSDDIIQECKFETFSWVLVKTVAGSQNEAEEERVPNAVQVWPIPDQAASQNTPHVILTSDALVANCIALGSPVSISKLNQIIFNPAKLVGVILKGNCEVDEERFCDTVKRKLRYRTIASGNCFKTRFYSEVVEFQVQSISGLHSDTDTLTRKFEHLNCSGDDIKSEISAEYFEVCSDTKIFIERDIEKKDDPALPLNPLTLDDVGGMDTGVNELTSFIKYTFSTSDDFSHGVLIYGLVGTGKTLLWKAVCNTLKINPIVMRDFEVTAELQHMFSRKHSATSLEDAFYKAMSNQPAAIIIENLEVYAPASSSTRGNQLANFSWKLRSLMPSLRNTKVIVMATTANVDMIDPVLRAANSFEKEIETPVPSVIQREDICFKILNRMKHNLTSEQIKAIALSTHGYVGADLRGLFTQAAITLVREKFVENATSEDTIFAEPFSNKHVQEAMKTVHPSAMKSVLVDVPDVRWDDIGGQKELKFKLKQAIEWPLKHPEAFDRLGISPPKGILMYGPPGCSKTMIAKAIATESGLNFISVKGSELFSKWVGESEKAVQKIFHKAKQVAPCVVFFDEIDSLGGERGSSSSGASNVHERVLAQLLVEIDGVEPLKEVTIVAATNRPDIIDQALLRPGRLDRIIYVPLPDAEAREEILKIWFRKMPVNPNVDVKPLVKLTEGYSGAELTAVCHEAALHALDENIKATVINESHFQLALKTVKPRISKEQLLFYEEYNTKLKVV